MEDEKTQSDKPQLTVTVTNSSMKAEGEKYFAGVENEMETDLKAKANQMAINQVLKLPVVASLLQQGMTFLPLIVKKGEDYLEKGKVMLTAYIDEETGAFVIEKMHTDKIELVRKEDPDPKDFFIVEKKDLDNPQEFIKIMQAKLNLNIF